MLKELSALNELHDKVDPVGLLENIVHSNYKRMVHLIEDEFLDLERLYGFVLYHDIFSDNLHREVFVLQFIAHEIDFAESATTYDANELEVIPGHLSDGGSSIQQGRAAVFTALGSLIEEELCV